MKPHTVMYYTTHICIRQSTLSRWMDHDVSKPKLFSGFFFFLSLSHSVKAISVFLKSVGVIWEVGDFSSVFFHSGSTSFSLFLSSERRKPVCQREFTFSHMETLMVILKIQMLCTPIPATKKALFARFAQKNTLK